MTDTDADIDRIQHIVAEQRAWELVEALKAAISGSPHWRFEAQRLLETIGNGEMREPRR